MSIYQELILDHYKNPRNFGSLNNKGKTSSMDNPSCGDKIVMEILLKNGIIDDIRFSGTGCAISMAAASMLTEEVKKKSEAKVGKMTAEDIVKLLGIGVSPNRLKCALLPLEVLQKCLV